jgi:hypothetical protein
MTSRSGGTWRPWNVRDFTFFDDDPRATAFRDEERLTRTAFRGEACGSPRVTEPPTRRARKRECATIGPMRTHSYRAVATALISLLLLAAIGAVVWIKRGIPFVQPREHWSIGIVEGTSPFSFDLGARINPVLTAADVTDVPAKFVADPFLVRSSEGWFLFFEVYNRHTRQGDLAYASSTDTRSWTYRRIILDEPFHLSYPYVFEWQGQYYLIPESYEARSVRLYRATKFPDAWQFVTELIRDRELVDNSIAHFNGRWWLFSCEMTNDTLRLFHADDLTGPWIEHPASPIVRGDLHKARPSGRVLVHEGRLYRYTMDVAPPVGTHRVFAYEVTNITPATYAERLVQPAPVLEPAGEGWNGEAMHQIDPVQLTQDRWIASVDGFGRYPILSLAR